MAGVFAAAAGLAGDGGLARVFGAAARGVLLALASGFVAVARGVALGTVTGLATVGGASVNCGRMARLGRAAGWSVIVVSPNAFTQPTFD
jgi:hypothetical protein